MNAEKKLVLIAKSFETERITNAQIDSAARQLRTSASEVSLLRKDAERYRWLRERETDVRRYTLVGQRASERLDDQIDAAIEESKAVGAA